MENKAREQIEEIISEEVTYCDCGCGSLMHTDTATDKIFAKIIELLLKERSFENEVNNEWNDYERERHEQFLLGWNSYREAVLEIFGGR